MGSIPQRKLARGNTGGTARISTDYDTGSRLLNPGTAGYLDQATTRIRNPLQAGE